jgi:hypothetical protein
MQNIVVSSAANALIWAIVWSISSCVVSPASMKASTASNNDKSTKCLVSERTTTGCTEEIDGATNQHPEKLGIAWFQDENADRD